MCHKRLVINHSPPVLTVHVCVNYEGLLQWAKDICCRCNVIRVLTEGEYGLAQKGGRVNRQKVFISGV